MDAIGTTGIGSTDPALTGGSGPGARTSPASSSPGAASTTSGADSYRSGQDQGAAGADGGYDRRGRPVAKSGQLSPAQQRQVQRLQARDAEVKAHEAAHQAAGGGLVGAASFTYQKGPDGRSYAIGGEVSIKAGSERTPAATISKMQQVIAAATAPAQPSGQDLAVAAQAQAAIAKAQIQAAQGDAGAEGTAAAAPAGGAAAPAQDPTGGIATRPDDETEAQDGAAEEAAEAEGTAATASTATATPKAEPPPVWAVKAPAAKTASMADAETQPAKAASTAGQQPVSGAATTDSASTATDTSNTASAGGLPRDLFGDRSPARLRRSVEVDELYRRLARGEVAGTVLDRKA